MAQEMALPQEIRERSVGQNGSPDNVFSAAQHLGEAANESIANTMI